jgi:hypothetical protein
MIVVVERRESTGLLRDFKRYKDVLQIGWCVDGSVEVKVGIGKKMREGKKRC